MSKTGFAVFLVLIFCKGYSQQSFYFVLIQADNNQSFYARIDQKIVNSSSIGYLMMPQLKDSSYDLSIGFPKNIFPELKFMLRINKKDQDLQLKNLGDKGWALFNRLTQELSMPVMEDTSRIRSELRGIKEDNAFSRLMAGVVNDSSVLYNTYIPTEIRSDSLHTDSVIGSKLKLDTALGIKGKHVDSIAKGVMVRTNAKAKKITSKPLRPGSSSIQKIREQTSNSSLQLVYLDHAKRGPADTVRLAIPLENLKIDGSSFKSSSPENSAAVGNGEKPGTTKATGLLVDSSKAEPALKKKQANKIVLINSDCKFFATENDMDRLRLKVNSEKAEEEKIAVSLKYFKTKCFSVKQIKALSDLFSTDEQKFKFFDAAFPFISDYDNFLQLGELLSDPVYIARFKALVPKP